MRTVPGANGLSDLPVQMGLGANGPRIKQPQGRMVWGRTDQGERFGTKDLKDERTLVILGNEISCERAIWGRAVLRVSSLGASGPGRNGPEANGPRTQNTMFRSVVGRAQ